MGRRGKNRNYQRSIQYPPGKEKKKNDVSGKGAVSEEEEIVG